MSPIISNVNIIPNVIDEIAIGGGPPALAEIDNNFSMEFDGADDYITTGLDCSSATHPNLSVSYWMKSSSAPGLTFPVGVLAAGSNPRFISLGLLNGGTLYYKANGSWVSGGSVTDGNWHNIVWTFEWNTPLAGNITCNVYLDGNTTPVISAVDLASGNLVGNLFIGSLDPNHTFPCYFPGKVDEVAVWESILSPSDIERIYNATSAGTPDKTADLSDLSTPPMAWYRMGD
jgi:hypothetical protein